MVNLFKVGLLCSYLILQECLLDILCGMELGLCNSHVCTTSQIRTFSLDLGLGMKAFQVDDVITLRANKVVSEVCAHPSRCQGVLTFENSSFWRRYWELKLSLFFAKKNSHDTQWVSNRYSSDITRKKWHEAFHKMECTCLWAFSFSKCRMRCYTL
jgi:hypothetical protein